jgi:glycosyltransferase involved in cell wall biosynthesis
MSLTDPTYATTRLLTSHRPEGLKELPPNPERVAEGGLRTKGCYKATSPGQPLITIITVVHNRVHCLERCVQSVINQSYNNVEFIVIDGNSTDGTTEIIGKYDNQIDYWVSEPDHGLYFAMNKAVDIALGDWFCFIGSDDILLDCLANIAPQLLLDTGIYCGDVYGIKRKELYNGPFGDNQLHVNRFYSKGIHHQGMFYPRSLFALNTYDTTYKISADLDLNLQCFSENRYKFSQINELVAIFNDIDGLSSKEFRTKMKENRTIFLKHLGIRGFYYICRMSFICLLETLNLKKALKRLLSFELSPDENRDKYDIVRILIDNGYSVEEPNKISDPNHD